jgi:hypothetical protein
MNTRRFRKHTPSETLARVRWFGWVMLMMFVLVQMAMGADPAGGRSERAPVEEGGGPFFQASADFNSETHQVTVKAPAPAAAWDYSSAIGRRSFVVYEDNVRQPVEDVDVAHTPLSIGVLLENGGRYHALNEAIAENVSRAVRDLMEAINPDDRVAMWTYGEGVQSLDSSAQGASGVQRTYLNLPVPPSSESNLYDALLATLPRVQQMDGRKVLIVVSSGIDSFSKAGFPDVLRAERETGVPVCVINIGPLLRSTLLVGSSDGQQPYAQLKWQQASSQLSRMASVSGCRALMPDSSFKFPAVYDGLLTNLRLQYVIRYQSTALDLPGTRQVKIAWVDGNGRLSGLTQNTMRRDREFAQAQYELDPAVVFAGTGALNWSFLRSTAARIQIPLKAPVGTETRLSALLAAVTTQKDSSRESLGGLCNRSPCIQ